MRTVSFVDNIEFEYQGNIFSKAVTVGDVDNDKNNEVVVGNMAGEVCIFKGKSKKPWAKSVDLGTITCLKIGDVCNHGLNFLVVLTAEGWCHVFVVQLDHIPQDDSLNSDDVNPITLVPTHKQNMLANNKDLIIADINGDGFNELVVGYSDRQTCLYRWRELSDQLTMTPGTLCGQFELLDTWTLAGQLGSVTANKRTDGMTDLIVSQPGGTFVTLHSKHTANPRDYQQDDQEGAAAGNRKPPESGQSSPWLVFHPLGSARARNTGVTTEVVASISRKKKGQETEVPNYSAICTLDGTLTLLDEDKILWSLYVDHQLFSLAKLDVTDDGTQEVVACSWDGHTYIVNLNKEVVRFKFRENVAAFCAGYYAVEKDKNVPCLFYFTFNNRIVMYYKLNMLEIANTTLVEAMAQQDAVVDQILPSLNCDGDSRSQVRQLYHWCLYGYHPKVP